MFYLCFELKIVSSEREVFCGRRITWFDAMEKLYYNLQAQQSSKKSR